MLWNCETVKLLVSRQCWEFPRGKLTSKLKSIIRHFLDEQVDSDFHCFQWFSMIFINFLWFSKQDDDSSDLDDTAGWWLFGPRWYGRMMTLPTRMIRSWWRHYHPGSAGWWIWLQDDGSGKPYHPGFSKMPEHYCFCRKCCETDIITNKLRSMYVKRT